MSEFQNKAEERRSSNGQDIDIHAASDEFASLPANDVAAIPPHLLHIRCRNSDKAALKLLQEFSGYQPEEAEQDISNKSNSQGHHPRILYQGYFLLTCYICELEGYSPSRIQDLASSYFPLLMEFYHQHSHDYEQDPNETYPALLFLVGIFQYYGLGCEKDIPTAIAALEKSTNYGFVLSQCCLGNYYYSQSSDPTGVHDDSTNTGTAMTVTDNGLKAYELYSLAAQQGYSIAQYNLGLCYENGCGSSVPMNPELAWKYYNLSSQQGNAAAQYHLGNIYEVGEFCTLFALASVSLKNMKLAYEHYLLAAKNGYALAQYTLGMCYEYGFDKILSKDYELAAQWYEQAAKHHHPISQYTLGHFYEYGKGVQKDLPLAVKWYQAAALNGHLGGQLHCGWCYQFGQGVSQDIDEAIRYYEMVESTNELYYKLTGDNITTMVCSSQDDQPPELADDRIHRALSLQNLSTCLEEKLKLKEASLSSDVVKESLLKIYAGYLLSEYLFQGDKRQPNLTRKKLQIQRLIVDCEGKGNVGGGG